MTRRLFNPFLLLLARLTDPELARAVQFLKTENAMLRSRLPKRVNLTPKERDRLFRLGEPLGVALRELVSIVTYRTFLRWKVDRRGKTRTRAPNLHPNRTPEQIRELVIRLASETGWGRLVSGPATGEWFRSAVRRGRGKSLTSVTRMRQYLTVNEKARWPGGGLSAPEALLVIWDSRGGHERKSQHEHTVLFPVLPHQAGSPPPEGDGRRAAV